MKRHSRDAWARLSTVLMPLVDLVMLLVLFFALAQGVIQTPLVQLELPEATQGIEADRPQSEPIVSVDARGDIFLDGAPLAVNDLAGHLQPGVKVRVRADQATPYAQVRRVLDALRDQGVLNVRLAVAPFEAGPRGDAP